MTSLLNWPDAQHIYLSPHLDDVALSCGGTIYQQAQRGERIAVITVFAGSPPASAPLSAFARTLHERWQASAPAGSGSADPPAIRRAEDHRAFSVLGPEIEIVHLPLPDCIYRRDPSGGRALYASEEAIFGIVQLADPALKALATVPPFPEGATLYAPLGVGCHVDHQIVRWAVDHWGLPVGQVRYYEDYPYSTRPGALSLALEEREKWQPIVVPLPRAALEAKIRAVARYASQISTFWPDIETMAQALRTHAQRCGGERLWVRHAP